MPGQIKTRDHPDTAKLEMQPGRKRILLGFLRQLPLWPRHRAAPRASKPRALPVTESPVLSGTWRSLAERYFPQMPHLAQYQVGWSRRSQKRTLGSCNTRQRKIIVARELNCELGEPWIEPLLYHEMCHAVLESNVPKRGGRRQWHGREFKSLVRGHPQTAALEGWMKSGGWGRLVRSDRARRAAMRRKELA